MGKRVIPGTCRVCGNVPGCESRPLTHDEKYGLLDAGYTLDLDVFGRDIAAPPDDVGWFNDALAHFHRAGHPKPRRPTWHQLVLAEGWMTAVAVLDLADLEPVQPIQVVRVHEQTRYELHYTDPLDGGCLRIEQYPSESSAREAMAHLHKAYGNVNVFIVWQQWNERLTEPNNAWDKILNNRTLDDETVT